MGRKPKTSGTKAKATDPEQSARFIEAARQAGVDETGEAFERAFERVVVPEKPRSVSRRTSRTKKPCESAE